MIDPDDCRTMAEVRDGVDATDRELAALLGQRFRFMDAAARIKANRGAVRDEPRKAQVLENAERAALGAGVPAGVATALWETLVEASIAYELAVWDQLFRLRQGEPHGASDGARTRDLRRDRPAL